MKNKTGGESPANPAKVTFLEGRGEMPMIEVTTPWSTAEIYLHGAHVTHFKKHHEPPILFLSQCSCFEAGKPIRGGVPIVFPWFGPREGAGMHGFARNLDWALKEIAPAADGSISLRFELPRSAAAETYPAFTAEYLVKVHSELDLQLSVTNNSEKNFEFENCLHTYFFVEDITAVSIRDLKGVSYLDRLTGRTQIENDEAIRIASEVDRTYSGTRDTVTIADHRIGRKILVEKKNSASTVVWNPWIEKSQRMADFGNEEFNKMVCVESGNVAGEKIVLALGETSVLTVKLSSAPLD